MMNCLRPQTEHVQDNGQTGNNCQVCFRLRVRRRCLDQIPIISDRVVLYLLHDC